MNIQREKQSVAMLSVISNSALVLLKLIVGFLIGSVSVLSEAIHSGVDLLAALIAFFAVIASGKPPDRDHSHGHGKFENISGTVEAVLIFAAAGWIIFVAARKLINPREIDEVGWGVAVMFVSSAVNFAVSNILFRVGKKTDSIALQADAWHLRTDVYTSAGVMAGLLIIWAGKMAFPDADLRWVDPVAAIFVALLIIKAAYDLTVKSVRDLLDRTLPSDEERLICKRIEEAAPELAGYHNLKTRKAGSTRFIEVEVVVDADMSVADSHAMTDLITDRIKTDFPDAVITIHVEPCNRQCDPECVRGCLLPRKAGNEPVSARK